MVTAYSALLMWDSMPDASLSYKPVGLYAEHCVHSSTGFFQLSRSEANAFLDYYVYCIIILWMFIELCRYILRDVFLP